MKSVLISKWFTNIRKGPWSGDIFRKLYVLWSWSVLIIIRLRFLFIARVLLCKTSFGLPFWWFKSQHGSNIIIDLVDERRTIIEYQSLTLKNVHLHEKLRVNRIKFYVFLKFCFFTTPNKYPCWHPWNKKYLVLSFFISFHSLFAFVTAKVFMTFLKGRGRERGRHKGGRGRGRHKTS